MSKSFFRSMKVEYWLIGAVRISCLEAKFSGHGLALRSSPWAVMLSWNKVGGGYLGNSLGMFGGTVQRNVRGNVCIPYRIASLQLFMCSGYDVVPLPSWLTHIHTQGDRHTDTFWPAILLPQPAELKMLISILFAHAGTKKTASAPT